LHTPLRAHQAPGIPCALQREGGKFFLNNSGALRRENTKVCEIKAMSFRDGLKDQTRNLEIPGSMLRIAPE
jgi:hypothetical protein